MKRGFSPIIATVLIIAVTLIAAVAIGGFVFGIFGPKSQFAEVQVTGTTLTATGFGKGISGAVDCVISAPVAPYLTLTNVGSGVASVTGVTITWAGASNNFATTSQCSVGGAGSPSAVTYVQFIGSPDLTKSPVLGQSYSGTVTLANGAQLLFTGSFQ